MNKERSDIARQILDQVTTAGATGDLIIDAGESISLKARDGELEEYHRFSTHFDKDVYGITAKSSAAARDNPGGTAPNRVAEELRRAKELLEANTNGF